MSAQNQVALPMSKSAGVSDAEAATESWSLKLLTGERIRRWSLRSGFALLDQGLTSGAGFLINLLLARWLPADLYGAFAVAFAGSLFVSGFHNVLLLEPLSVIGPARHFSSLPQYFRAQIRVHWILVGIFSGLVLPPSFVLWRTSPSNPLAGSLVGGALALPCVLLLWLARRMCYAMQHPRTASLGAAIYLSLVVVGLVALRLMGRASPFGAFVLLGCCSFVAALVIFRQLGLLWAAPVGQLAMSWRAVLHENWKYGRWLVASAALFSVAAQTQIFLIPVFLGLGAAGILRAMQIPALVMTQIVAAIGLLVLPALAHDFGQGHHLR